MIVCHCMGVNDRKVRRAIEGGARSVAEVAMACGAGSRCGGCWPALQALIRASEVVDLRDRAGADSAA